MQRKTSKMAEKINYGMFNLHVPHPVLRELAIIVSLSYVECGSNRAYMSPTLF